MKNKDKKKISDLLAFPFHIVSSIEFASHALISDYDKNVMQQLHDVLLHIISSR